MNIEATPPSDEALEIGSHLGTSEWYEMTQPIIDAFGGLTEDLEPLHNDPDWCVDNSPYGVPISFGFLTLAMLTRWLHQATGKRWSGMQERSEFPINYGFERIRFISPVRVGERLRAHFRLKDRQLHKTGNNLLTFDITVEIEGGERPALTAEWLFMWVDR